MTQSRSVCSRIRNAKASLDNAERSFRSNQEVRGELDLMLAEAELDNLRQKRPGIFWTRHTLAVCFAVLVLASGCLGWWWASAYGGNTTNAAGLQGTPAVAEKNEPAINTDKQASAYQLNSTPSSVASEQKEVINKKTDTSVRTVAPPLPQIGTKSEGIRLSAGEMRRLIRSGKQELENIR